MGTVAEQDDPPGPREVTPLTPTVRPVALALQAKLSASSPVHVRAPTWSQALPLDGSHLACVASSSLRPPASKGGKRLEPKGALEEPDAPALSHRAQDEAQAFLVSAVPEGSPGHAGVPGVIVDAGWCSPGRMGSGVLGVNRDMFSLLPSHLVMEPQVEFPGPQRGMSKAQPGNISQTPSRTGGSPGPSAAGSAWTSV